MSFPRVWLTVVVASGLVGLLSAGAPAAKASQADGSIRLEPSAQDSEATIARGAYIVENVVVCSRCHSPANSSGERERGQWLMGGAVDMRPTSGAPDWALVAPRIAGTPAGTDEEIVRLLMTGISRTGKRLRQPMPQFRMTQPDAEAVLAYLKSLKGGRSAVRSTASQNH